MLKIYCATCGNPTTYTSAKPKFCSACGTPFDKLVVNKVLIEKPLIDRNKTIDKNKLARKASSISEEAFDDDSYDGAEDVTGVPNISKLECDVVESSYRGGEKLGNLIGTMDDYSERRNPSKNEKKSSKQDRRKFLEEFSKEAGALKPKTRNRKNGA